MTMKQQGPDTPNELPTRRRALVHSLVDLGVEARVGIEPTHKGFADLSLTAWVPRHLAQL